jgi:SAM-dependent methyltransferase
MMPIHAPGESPATATAEDVVNCYRVLLGREPSAADQLAAMSPAAPARWQLIQAVILCEEMMVRQLGALGEHISTKGYHNLIETDGTPEQLATLLAHVRRVWANYGDQEPYWSVLTDPMFYRSAMDQANEDLFYSSGRAGCDLVANACARNGLAMPKSGSVLDFGCGVGRLGEHLSKDFAHYLGVDISRPHLNVAAKRMARLGRTNCDFQPLQDFLESATTFDAFISVIVLQHNPPPIIDRMLNELLRRLKPGGVGYFQVPCFLHNYEFRLAAYLAGLGNSKQMEMHALPQRRVFDAIADNGCRLVEATLDGLIGNLGLSYTFLVRKPS